MNDNNNEADLCTNKEHRKYVLVILTTVAVTYLFSLYWVQTNPMVYESREYPMWKHVKEQINTKKSPPLKVIVIGDSRVKAGYEPSLVGIDTLNLAVGGSTTIEGYYTLLTYIENNSVPENVVLSYSPLYLMRNKNYWERTVKYDYLRREQYNNIIRDSRQYGEPGIGDIDLSWKYSYLTSMYISSVVVGLMEKRWLVNLQTYEEVKENKGHAYFGIKRGSASLNDEVKLANDFHRSELIHFYFIKLINLAKSHGISLYWYTMPFNNASCKKISPKLVSNFNKYIDSIKIETGINIIKKIHCLDNKYFGDGSHVFRGSNITTKDIIMAIK